MTKAIIQMYLNQTDSLHNGHRALIEFAKTQADEVVIALFPQAYSFFAYYYGISKTISPILDYESNNQKIADILAEGCSYMIPHYLYEPIDSTILLTARAQATSLVNANYALELGSERQMMRTIGTLTRRLANPTKLPGDIEVMGPEIQLFVLKDSLKYIPWNPISIYTQIVKDQNTGMKSGGYYDKLSEEEKSLTKKIKKDIDSAISLATIGDNLSLKTEINESNKSSGWKFVDLLINEGGIVPGRLETVTIQFDSGRYLEDVNYIL